MVVRDERLAFEALFRANHAAVHRYAMRRVEEAAVQDVVAETFLVAWRRHAEIADDPLPWLLGVARRVCANHLRGRQRRVALGERLAAQPYRPPSSGALSEDGELKLALSSLGEFDREALLLVAWDGLSNRDAAKVVGCSKATFAVRLHRARGRLARALESQDGNRPANRAGVEGMATSDVH
jgi:RNA polymerase sigma-70 factor (ECF subfamily)